MREILFRGFCECDNGNQTIHIDGKSVYGKWLYGYPVIDNALCTAKAEGKCKCPHDGSDSEMLVWDDDYHEYDAVPVISSTIGQYTVLKDKNGKRIFDGDIIRCWYHRKNLDDLVTTERVVYYQGAFRAFNEQNGAKFWSSLPNNDGCRSLDSVYIRECEIIGNIYENPELVEGGMK